MRDLLLQIKEWIEEHKILPKLVCLLLSFVTWTYVKNSKIGTLRYEIPIEITNKPDNVIVSKMSEKTVNVELEGRNELLKNIKKLRAIVNMQRPKLGTKKYYIKISKEQIPESIQVRLKKKFVSITLEKELQKRVKVIPRIVGNVSDGHIQGRYTIKPSYILVSGPRSVIKRMNYIYTEDVNINDRSSNFTKEIEIDRDKYENVTFSEYSVKVFIPVISYKDLLSLEVPVMVKNQNPRYNYSLKTNKVKVYLRSSSNKGGDTVYKSLNLKSIDVSVDVGDINLKKLDNRKVSSIEENLPVKIVIKNNRGQVNIVSLKPDTILVTISKKK